MRRTPIDIEGVVHHLGCEAVPRKKDLFRCPACGHRALKISVEKNAWYCFACEEGGGAVRLASMAWGIAWEEADERLRGELGIVDEDDDPANLLARLDALENTPEEVTGDDGSRDILHAWWIGSERICRIVRHDWKGKIDPDTFFAPIEDAINAGTLDCVGVMRLCAKAARTIDGVLERMTGVVWVTRPVKLHGAAWLRATKACDRQIKDFLTKVRARWPNAPIEPVVRAMTAYHETTWRKAWTTTT